jgi:hypothetical protein
VQLGRFDIDAGGGAGEERKTAFYVGHGYLLFHPRTPILELVLELPPYGYSYRMLDACHHHHNTLSFFFSWLITQPPYQPTKYNNNTRRNAIE